MFIKVLIITVILVAFIILALGVKIWFNPNAEFTAHSCALDDGSLDKDGACSQCKIKELIDNIGQFEYEIIEDGIKIYGYKP